MPTFHIRAWSTQTLIDSRDYEVAATSIEEALKRLSDLQDQANHKSSTVQTDETIKRVEYGLTSHSVAPLDPTDIKDGDTGYTLIDALGNRRELLQPVDEDVSLAPFRVTFRENSFEHTFDCSAEDADHAREQWADTYPNAVIIAIEPIQQPT